MTCVHNKQLTLILANIVTFCSRTLLHLNKETIFGSNNKPQPLKRGNPTWCGRCACITYAASFRKEVKSKFFFFNLSASM